MDRQPTRAGARVRGRLPRVFDGALASRTAAPTMMKAATSRTVDLQISER
ncbi:MAG TPA: hypothetical protein VN628_11535 [Vicinamibacterales bacterium]|nr:hypothetical protein [Vicinamibacterales bacterium]